MKDSTHLTRRQIISAGAAATGIAGAGAFRVVVLYHPVGDILQ